jgi:thiosulfate/3-mercaptopyruvate sulfurtransferase
MHDAARFVWQLRMLGLENVSYLDGGINAWIAAGHPTGRGLRLVDQAPVTQFRARSYDPWDFDVPMSRVRDALLNPNDWVVIDARAPEEYAGRQTGSSAGAYGTGRKKGAVHINWTEAVDSSTQLIRSRAELEAIYGDVIRGKNVIIHCQSGVRSAHTWLVLTQVLGARNVYNYDGSWIEWSFAASEASGTRFPGILELTEEWTDNRRPI